MFKRGGSLFFESFAVFLSCRMSGIAGLSFFVLRKCLILLTFFKHFSMRESNCPVAIEFAFLRFEKKIVRRKRPVYSLCIWFVSAVP